MEHTDAATATPRPARLGQRVAARFMDQLLVGVLNVVALQLLPVDPLEGLTEDPPTLDTTSLYYVVVLVTVLNFAYFAFFESRWGMTPAKRMIGLRVRSADGGPTDTLGAFKRNAWILLGLIPLPLIPLQLVAAVLIVVTIRAGTEARGWHDRFAGTAVVQT